MIYDISPVLEGIKEGEKVAIFGHRNPDGDALGSTLALSQVLDKLGIDNQVITPNPYPESFSWMEKCTTILNYDEHREKVSAIMKETDWFFFLDFNNPSRLGALSDDNPIDLQKAVIIDHHPEPNRDVAFLYSDTKKSSTCELVYHVLKASNLEAKIDANVASCIFTGMMTDTGGFNHNSSSPEFFRTIARLIELGADKELIYQRVFHTQNESRFKLLGEILHKNLDLNYELGVAIMWLDAKDMRKHRYQTGDTEGFVNMPLSLDGINKSVLVTEMDQEVKLSFRSRSGYTINTFASAYFNGGGHKNAAGGRSLDSFDNTMKKLYAHIKEL